MRGEYHKIRIHLQNPVGSPPHARGILVNCLNILTPIPNEEIESKPVKRITPACAGNTDQNRTRITFLWDHPRMRGEYLNKPKVFYFRVGSPPHARGILKIFAISKVRVRITPACAGNTHIPNAANVSIRDHPRMRGEYTKITAQLQHSHHITSHSLFSSK